MKVITSVNGNAFPAPRIDWIFKDENGKPVSTFYPKVLRTIDVYYPNGGHIYSLVQLKLHFKEDVEREIQVQVSELKRLDWSELDRRCLINSENPRSKGYIANVIRIEMLTAPVEIQYKVDRLGIVYINDKIVFVAGDRVITQSPDKNPLLNIDVSGLPFKLDINPKLTKKEAIEGMIELIYLNPEVGKVLVAHVISGIIRAAYKEAHFTPSTVLMVVGKSGMLKSNYISHIAQLYNRADKIRPDTRLNSTKRFVEDLLYQYRECTVVIDDLHSAEASGIKRMNENTAEEIIRRIGDDTGRGYKKGHELVQNSFMGNAVLIGEYITGKKSTLPRMLVVEVTKKSEGALFDKYQRHQPLLVSTFYYFFIQWYVNNYKDICNEIDKRLTKFREENVDSDIHGRLLDTQFYLRTSYMAFLRFCQESYCISEEEAKEEYASFQSQLIGLIRAQQVKFVQDNKEGTDNDVDCIKILQKLYKAGELHLAKSIDKFNPQKHDGLVYNNYKSLCLRGECIERIIDEYLPNSSKKRVIQSLLDKNALKLVSEKHTVQIKGKRFYAIKLKFLNN